MRELLAGLTVALVAVPQCVGFATIAGLPPVTGLVTAVVMGLASAAISKSPSLVVGPAITSSTMLLSVLRTVEPHDSSRWPGIAASLAVAVGVLTILGLVIGIGRLAHFVSRSVIVGLVVGSVLLTIGSQVSSILGVSAGTDPTLLGMLYRGVERLGETSLTAVFMALGVFTLVHLGFRLGPRFPAAFVALALSGVVAWILETRDIDTGLKHLAPLSWSPAVDFQMSLKGLNLTNLFAGASAMTLIGIIQSLAIGKAILTRTGEQFNANKELASLGFANMAAGVAQGFPGSASFARSALADLVGVRTRFASLVTALSTGVIALVAAPLTRYVTAPALAGLLVATAISMIDWVELKALARDVNDRPILILMIACVFVLPIHWAILIGIVVSLALLLRRVSRVYVFEMVRSVDGPFREKEIDDQTGRSAITMLQLEGPLFFAHADQLAARLRGVFRQGPRVTIVRMRRTQHVDFSILASLRPLIRDYQQSGGCLILCGLTQEMKSIISNSLLGELISQEFLLETTREVFGSAHVAIERATQIIAAVPAPGREMFRVEKAEK